MRSRRLSVYDESGHQVGSVFMSKLSMHFRMDKWEPYDLAVLCEHVTRREFIQNVREYCEMKGLRVGR